MARRRQAVDGGSGERSRSFIWLPANVMRKFYCTKCDGEMSVTNIAGYGDLSDANLWVCRACEPRVEGRWLAEVEQKQRRESRKEINRKVRETQKSARARIS